MGYTIDGRPPSVLYFTFDVKVLTKWGRPSEKRHGYLLAVNLFLTLSCGAGSRE